MKLEEFFRSLTNKKKLVFPESGRSGPMKVTRRREVVVRGAHLRVGVFDLVHHISFSHSTLSAASSEGEELLQLSEARVSPDQQPPTDRKVLLQCWAGESLRGRFRCVKTRLWFVKSPTVLACCDTNTHFRERRPSTPTGPRA